MALLLKAYINFEQVVRNTRIDTNTNVQNSFQMLTRIAIRAPLMIIFALTMVLSQKAMMSMNKNAQQDPAQAAMQKSMNTFMPIMLTFTFVIIPIPAGVLLYLIASNCFQVLQTVIINKQLEAEDAKKANKIDDDDVANAKVIKEKE